jgi:hypothetical protein
MAQMSNKEFSEKINTHTGKEVGVYIEFVTTQR